MATWQTDVLGTGLAHTTPTRQELLLARRIARRWKEWEPLLLHELRQRPREPGFVAREMLRLERVHAAAMAKLLNVRDQSNRLARIARLRLDDPRLDEDTRDRFTNQMGPPSKEMREFLKRHSGWKDGGQQ